MIRKLLHFLSRSFIRLTCSKSKLQRYLNAKYRSLRIKMYLKVIYYSNTIDQDLPDNIMAIAIRRINSKLKIFQRKNRILSVPVRFEETYQIGQQQRQPVNLNMSRHILSILDCSSNIKNNLNLDRIIIYSYFYSSN